MATRVISDWRDPNYPYVDANMDNEGVYMCECCAAIMEVITSGNRDLLYCHKCDVDTKGKIVTGYSNWEHYKLNNIIPIGRARKHAFRPWTPDSD